MFLPTSSILSLVSIIIFLGDNFLPVIFAGHTLVHLPHSVHEYAFNNWSQERSITSEAPKFISSLTSDSFDLPIIIFTSFVTDFMLFNLPISDNEA